MTRNAFRLWIGVPLLSLVLWSLWWRSHTSLDLILNRLSLGMPIDEVYALIPQRNLDGHCVPLDVEYISEDNSRQHDNGDDLFFWQTIQNRSGSIKNHLLFDSRLKLCFIPNHNETEPSGGFPDYSLEVFTVSVATNFVLPGLVTTKEPTIWVDVWTDGLCDVSFPKQIGSFTFILPEELMKDFKTGILPRRRVVDLAQIQNLSSVEKKILTHLSINIDPLVGNESNNVHKVGRQVLSMIREKVENEGRKQR